MDHTSQEWLNGVLLLDFRKKLTFVWNHKILHDSWWTVKVRSGWMVSIYNPPTGSHVLWKCRKLLISIHTVNTKWSWFFCVYARKRKGKGWAMQFVEKGKGKGKGKERLMESLIKGIPNYGLMESQDWIAIPTVWGDHFRRNITKFHALPMATNTGGNIKHTPILPYKSFL